MYEVDDDFITSARLLNDIKNAKGTNKKKEILLSGKTNDLFKSTLKLIFDPARNSGIGRAAFFDTVCEGSIPPESLGIKPYGVFLFTVSTSNSRHEWKQYFKSRYDLFMLRGDKAGAQLIYYLATKDCPIGISMTTVNQVFHGLIPKFEIMLCSKFPDKIIDEPISVTKKLDGVNLTARVQDGNVQFITRQGKTVDDLLTLQEHYKHFSNGYYFGEAIYFPEGNKTTNDRKEIYRRTSGMMNTKGEKRNIIHNIFAYSPLNDFDNETFYMTHEMEMTYIKMQLDKYSLIISQRYQTIFMVPVVDIKSSSHGIEKLASKEFDSGGEGLVVRKLNSIYEKKRSKNIFKVKSENTVDLRIVGYKEHKNGNKLGAFDVMYKDGSVVGVGSGFTDTERDIFWKVKDHMLGQIIEVKFMEECQDKDGKKSLRFPTFVRLRKDKDTPSFE